MLIRFHYYQPPTLLIEYVLWNDVNVLDFLCTVNVVVVRLKLCVCVYGRNSLFPLEWTCMLENFEASKRPPKDTKDLWKQVLVQSDWVWAQRIILSRNLLIFLLVEFISFVCRNQSAFRRQRFNQEAKQRVRFLASILVKLVPTGEYFILNT